VVPPRWPVAAPGGSFKGHSCQDGRAPPDCGLQPDSPRALQPGAPAPPPCKVLVRLQEEPCKAAGLAGETGGWRKCWERIGLLIGSSLPSHGHITSNSYRTSCAPSCSSSGGQRPPALRIGSVPLSPPCHMVWHPVTTLVWHRTLLIWPMACRDWSWVSLGKMGQCVRVGSAVQCSAVQCSAVCEA
jgi:hypothetical protein